MLDSSGLGVGAVVMVVQGGGSVGKIMLMLGGMEGVGMGVDGGGVVQEAVKRSKERRKRKEGFRLMVIY